MNTIQSGDSTKKEGRHICTQMFRPVSVYQWTRQDIVYADNKKHDRRQYIVRIFA